jgi:hypothetical protein
MTQTITPKRRDRWADWAVIGLLAVALLLGTAVMALAQGQTKEAVNAAAGLTVHYPQGWLLKPADNLAFQAVNPNAADFKTAYQVQTMPIVAGDAVTPTLALALNNFSLSRAQGQTAYRLFDTREGQPLDGQPTMEATYAYVLKGNDLFSQRLPVVVQGLDIAVARGDQAVIFSLLASKDAFAAAEMDFRRFVESAELR